jgi:hypothetical protein
MASTIIASTIDENFPVAGVDNDSQGFRDNFNIVKTALSTAKNEISDLQDGVARIDENSNFGGNQIIEAALLATTQVTNETYASGLGSTTDVDLSWEGGHVYVIKVESDVTLRFRDFATENYSVMRVFLYSDDNTWNVTLASLGGTVKYGSGFPSPLTATSSTAPKIIEVSTFDAGVTTFIRYLGMFA